MEEKHFVIDQSKLEVAHLAMDKKWLDTTFNKASQVIENGGNVKINQRFSDASMELVALIDNLEGLNHYIKKYSV